MSFNTNTDIWFAGAFAAFTVDLLVYPLDTLKTRIQSPQYTTLYKRAAPLHPIQPSASLLSAFSPTTRFNPALFRGLYQGIWAVIFVTIPSSGAFFTTYEALKSGLNAAIPPNSSLYLPQPAIHALSSAGAELVSCAILTPAEVLKQNAQVWDAGKGSKTSSARVSPTLAVLSQFRHNPRSLFRGYGALAGRNLPFTGLQFPLFEHLKILLLDRRKRQRQLQQQQPNSDLEKNSLRGKIDYKSIPLLERAVITSISAALAGTVAAYVTTPIDVIKTRIMLDAGAEVQQKSPHSNPNLNPDSSHTSTTQKSPHARLSALQITRQILASEGTRGLFRGAVLRSLWTAVGSGLYLGCYEGGREFLEVRRLRKEGGDGDGEWGEGDGGGSGGGDRVGEDGKKRERRVGIGASRSQGEKVGRSAWEE